MAIVKNTADNEKHGNNTASVFSWFSTSSNDRSSYCNELVCCKTVWKCMLHGCQIVLVKWYVFIVCRLCTHLCKCKRCQMVNLINWDRVPWFLA